MVIASTVIIMQMNVKQPIFHSSNPIQRIQFGKHVLMPDVHAETQKWMVDFVYKVDK